MTDKDFLLCNFNIIHHSHVLISAHFTMEETPFAVVMFKDGIAIVRRDWLVYKNDNIVAGYFPPNVTASDLHKFLCGKNSLDFDKDKWTDIDGKPYEILHVYGFTSEYIYII